MTRFRLWLANLLCGPLVRELRQEIDDLKEERDTDRKQFWKLAETIEGLAGELNDLRNKPESAVVEPVQPRPRRATNWREFATVASQAGTRKEN